MSKGKNFLKNVKLGLLKAGRVLVWPFVFLGRLLGKGFAGLRRIQLRWLVPVLTVIALVSFLGFLYLGTEPGPEEDLPAVSTAEVEEERKEEPAEEEREVTEDPGEEEEREEEPVLVMPEREEPDADVPTFSLADLIRPVSGDIKTPYGWHYHEVFGDWRFHHGIDLMARSGTPVQAVWPGEIVRVRQDDLLGTVITIDHGSELRTKYGLLEQVNMESGDRVEKGEALGVVARAPLFGEPRLHFQLHRRGVPIDPGPYYRGWEGE